MAKKEKPPLPFDESPAALLSQELLFAFYRNTTTLAVAILGGIFSLRLALLPGEMPLTGGLIGFAFIALAIIHCISQQIDIANRLKTRTPKSSAYDKVTSLAGIFLLAVGTGMVAGSFSTELSPPASSSEQIDI